MTDLHALKQHFWDKLSSGPVMMVGLSAPHAHAEPLTAQLDKDQVNRIYFFIGRDNRLAGGGPATAQFVSRGQDYFASLTGTASIDSDRAMIDKLWSKAAEAWFPAGRNDPGLALLRFDIDSVELWESDMSLSGKLKMLFGGKISPSEEGSHARIDSTVV